MDDKWGGHKPAAIRLAPAESGAGPLPARCWHDGGSDGSAGAGPLHSQFALSPPVRCRLRRGWPQLPEPARWWAASAMLSGRSFVSKMLIIDTVDTPLPSERRWEGQIPRYLLPN